MSSSVQLELDSDVAVIRIDDGKVNAISPALLAEMNEALDRAEKEARCVAILGRPGRFSAGFDLSIMASGDQDAVVGMVSGGGRLLVRLYGFPTPVVVGCTGHAVAMGSLMLLAADTRIGAAGAFKIGLNEVSIKMSLPVFATELARDRLSRRHLQQATVHARLYDPEGAIDAGYLDRVVAPDALEQAVLEEARALTQLHMASHAATKQTLRGETLERIRKSLDGFTFGG